MGIKVCAAVFFFFNFTRSLSSWPRKNFEHSFLRIREGSNAQQLFAELLRAQDAFFSGNKADLLTGNDGGRPARGKPLIEWPVLICCAIVHHSSKSVFFLFLMYQRNSSITKTLMQQIRKSPGRYHSCAVLPVWPWCAGRIFVRPTSRSSV